MLRLWYLVKTNKGCLSNAITVLALTHVQWHFSFLEYYYVEAHTKKPNQLSLVAARQTVDYEYLNMTLCY